MWWPMNWTINLLGVVCLFDLPVILNYFLLNFLIEHIKTSAEYCYGQVCAPFSFFFFFFVISTCRLLIMRGKGRAGLRPCCRRGKLATLCRAGWLTWPIIVRCIVVSFPWFIILLCLWMQLEFRLACGLHNCRFVVKVYRLAIVYNFRLVLYTVVERLHWIVCWSVI